MKIFISICLFFVVTHSSFAIEEYGSIRGCGQYKIAGIIRKNSKDILHLVVNEKTASEFQFKPATGELPRFAGYIDIPIKLEVFITKLNGTQGEVSSPSGLKLMVPDPLHPKLNSGFILLKQKKCEKQ